MSDDRLGDAMGGQQLSEKTHHAFMGRGCLGCLVCGVIGFVLIFVCGLGLGLPYTYWLHISDMQLFEGPEGVVLFVEVERNMRYPGVFQEAPITRTIQLLRINVSRDGLVNRKPLAFEGDLTFNTNIAPIISLADHFYLVEEPSLGHPDCQLHRVNEGRIESLSIAESRAILQSVGLRCERFSRRRLDEFDELDKVSEEHGWRRINGTSRMFMGLNKSSESSRHNLRVRWAETGLSQVIVAESLSGDDRWTRLILTVNTRRWKSYRSPYRR